ncbi:MAG: ABC transporter permease [Acidimicrobiales bacterium]
MKGVGSRSGVGAALRSIQAFGGSSLAQLARDRSTLVFMVILPIAVMTIVGTTYGGTSELEVGIVDEGDAADAAVLLDIVDDFDDVRAEAVDDLSTARQAIRRGDIEAVVVTDPDEAPEERVAVIVNDLDGSGARLVPILQRAVARLESGSGDGGATAVQIELRSVGENRYAANSDFALTAAQNLVLFTFINALISATLLVTARQQGVIRRAFAGPTPRWALGVGIVGAWLIVAVLQSVLILAVAGIGFGVSWGDPVAVVLLTLVFALVGTGLALVVGSIARTEDQVGAFAPPVALVAGALGGCMVPSEVFPDVMLTVAKATPHHWALEGWKTLLFDGGSVGDVVVNLAVLGGFAVAAVGAAVWWLDRVLRVRGGL